MEATIGFSASNRYNYHLERRSNGSSGRLGRGSKEREIGMIGDGVEYIATASEDDEKLMAPADS